MTTPKTNGWEEKVYQWFHDQDIHIHSDRVQPLLETISQAILSAEERARREAMQEFDFIKLAEEYEKEITSMLMGMGNIVGMGNVYMFAEKLEEIQKSLSLPDQDKLPNTKTDDQSK